MYGLLYTWYVVCALVGIGWSHALQIQCTCICTVSYSDLSVCGVGTCLYIQPIVDYCKCIPHTY